MGIKIVFPIVIYVCVSVVHSPNDGRKILMKMSSDEPSFLSTRQVSLLLDTPSLTQGSSLDLSLPFPRKLPPALTPSPVLGRATNLKGKARPAEGSHPATQARICWSPLLSLLGKLEDTIR